MAKTDIDRLVNKIRKNPNDSNPHEIGEILQEYEFKASRGRRNIVYEHKDYPDLRIIVQRRQHLQAWVVNDTLKLVDKIIQRRKGD